MGGICTRGTLIVTMPSDFQGKVGVAENELLITEGRSRRFWLNHDGLRG